MQNVQSVNKNDSAVRTTPLPLRNDTILGICTALGEDMGFNANYLRVAIGSLVIFDILVAIGVYLALGVLVAMSRLLFPQRRRAIAKGASDQPAIEANDCEAAPETLAA